MKENLAFKISIVWFIFLFGLSYPANVRQERCHLRTFFLAFLAETSYQKMSCRSEETVTLTQLKMSSFEMPPVSSERSPGNITGFYFSIPPTFRRGSATTKQSSSAIK